MPEIEQVSQPDSLVERISAHRVAGAAPEHEIEWLAKHGRLRRLATGDILSSRALGPVEGLFIFLSGRVALFVARSNGSEKVMEWRGGDVGGVLPYSRLTAPPGDASAQEPTELVMIPRAALPELTRECQVFTTALVHAMVDRARHFTSSGLQAEKLASLGKLSAGLAHELNNPAAAVASSAGLLQQALAEAQRAAMHLGALRLDAQQQAAVEAVHAEAAGKHVSRTPLERSERESAFEDWLQAHGVEGDHAPTLADSALSQDALENLSRALPRAELLSAAVQHLAATVLVRQLAGEIQTSARRISNLVDAVKGFTHMDHSAQPGPVHVEAGLSQTVAIHNSKARAKSASLRLEMADALPRVEGVTSELNQVWANLLDNALDAVSTGGSVTITASHEGSGLVVRVTDDGHGIPAEIQGCIFDPFFTTKKVGEGTGLGLDIVRRIVSKHQGTLAVDSKPGRTQFTVTLPLAFTKRQSA